jgi:hypothetical protein
MKSLIPKERLRVSHWIVQRLYSYAVNVLPVGIHESHLGRYSNREEDQEATVARDGHAFVAERISAKCRGMGLAGRHRIELYGEGAGIVAVIDGDDLLEVARSLYWRAIMNHPNRLEMLCDRARIIAGSDQAETMPI